MNSASKFKRELFTCSLSTIAGISNDYFSTIIVYLSTSIDKHSCHCYRKKESIRLDDTLHCMYIAPAKTGSRQGIKKPQLIMRWGLKEVVLPRFELRQTEPKTVVLPLHHRTN